MREYVSVRDSVSDPNVSYIPVEWGKSAIDQQQKKKIIFRCFLVNGCMRNRLSPAYTWTVPIGRPMANEIKMFNEEQ